MLNESRVLNEESMLIWVVKYDNECVLISIVNLLLYSS